MPLAMHEIAETRERSGGYRSSPVHRVDDKRKCRRPLAEAIV